MISLMQLLKEVQGKPVAILLAGAPGAGKYGLCLDRKASNEIAKIGGKIAFGLLLFRAQILFCPLRSCAFALLHVIHALYPLANKPVGITSQLKTLRKSRPII